MMPRHPYTSGAGALCGLGPVSVLSASVSVCSCFCLCFCLFLSLSPVSVCPCFYLSRPCPHDPLSILHQCVYPPLHMQATVTCRLRSRALCGHVCAPACYAQSFPRHLLCTTLYAFLQRLVTAFDRFLISLGMIRACSLYGRLLLKPPLPAQGLSASHAPGLTSLAPGLTASLLRAYSQPKGRDPPTPRRQDLFGFSWRLNTGPGVGAAPFALAHLPVFPPTCRQYSTEALTRQQRGCGRGSKRASGSGNETRGIADPEPKDPTPRKEELLSRASTPLGRLWVHVKWPLLRNDRPFSMDEMSAFASWLVMGNVLWILLGTTTFVLSAIYFLDTFGRAWDYAKTLLEERGTEVEQMGNAGNTAGADPSFIGWLTGKVLSAGMGVDVTFRKGHLLPQLDDGMLKFRNLALVLKPSHVPSFEARIAELDVSLSFKKWYSGHGLITDLSIFGMHVRVDKSPAQVALPQTSGGGALPDPTSRSSDPSSDPSDPSDPSLDPLNTASALIDPHYHIHHIRIRDLQFDIHDRGSTTQISLFNCDMPRLRGNKLLVDFFNASIVTGTINNSMFSVHKTHTSAGETSTRFELKGIDLGYISANPRLRFNWLVAGKAEVSADIRMPDWHPSESISTSIARLLQHCVSEYGEATLKGAPKLSEPHHVDDDGLLKGAIVALYETFQSEKSVDPAEYVVVNATVRFSDLKACMPRQLPVTAAGVPFVTLQGLRSLVTYVNETARPLAIKTYGIEKVRDLDGTTGLTLTNLYECIVGDIYDDLLEKVKVDERRILEEKAVHWSHALMGQLFLIGLGVMA